jgi:hypothetical protein
VAKPNIRFMPTKKKFKDTAVGKFILNKVPDFVSDVLPDKGVLGIVKNLIDSDPDMSAEQKAQYHRELVELYQLEVADRDSARKRESEIKKSGGQDWMMFVTGLVGLFSFMFMIYAVVYIPSVLENDLFVHLMGVIEGVVISNIFAYYYGTSSDKK